MGCSLTKPDPGSCLAAGEQVLVYPEGLPQQLTPKASPGKPAAFLPTRLITDPRSRRASSLAPGPSTPHLGTPIRDAMYGSETTGRHFSWRATAALLQARARRLSGSTTADRAAECGMSMQASQDLTNVQPMTRLHRMASTDSTPLEFADISPDSLALQRKHVSLIPHEKSSLDYIAAVHFSPGSDSSALHTVSQCSSETNQAIPFCHHCGTLLRPKGPPSHTSMQQLTAEPQGLDARRAISGSFRRDHIKQRGPRRVSSSLAGPVQSRAVSAGSMSSQRGPSQHADVSPYPASQRRQVSVIAAVSADAASRQLSTFCGSQDFAGPGFNLSRSMYMPPPRPSNEVSRRNALEALKVMQDPPAAAFQDIAVSAAAAFGVSGVYVSLIGDTQTWSQSQAGQCGFYPRQLCLGTWMLLPNQPEVLVIPDALQDFRTQNHPLVSQEPGIRFFAAAAMTTSGGLRIGAMSLIDNKPWNLDAAGQKLLASFATMAVRQLEHASALRKQVEHAYKAGHAVALSNAIHSFPEPMMVLDISQPHHWRLLAVNQAWVAASGICRDHAEGSLLWDVFYMPNMAAKTAAQMCSESAARQSDFSLQLASQLDQEDRLTIKSMNFQFRPANSALVTVASSGIDLPAALQDNGEAVSEQFYVATMRVPQLPSALQPHAASMQRRGSTGSSCWQEEQNQELPAVQQSLIDPEPFTAVNLGPLLGSGGSGHVYRGTWNGATVAVKVVEAEHAVEDTSRTPLKPLEAMLSIDLSHPNIIHTYKYYTRIRQDGGDRFFEGTTEKAPKVSETWLVLEYCSKGSLQDALDRGWFRSRKAIMDGSADLNSIITTATEIASAMAYLHDLDILHADLSCNNILLASASDDQRGFTAKVADFGMARMAGQDEVIQTKAIGTITHMPPELMLDGALSHAVDVYAFGVVLWELYTAQRAWAGMRQAQIVHTVCSLEQQLEFPYGTPQPYEDLSMLCMSQNPDERPTFAQIVTRLEELSDLAATDPLEMMSEGYPMHIL